MTPVRVKPATLHLLDDSGPLGIRRFPMCAYPRRFTTYELGPIGSITLPESMTKREWDFLHQWLDLIRDSGRVVE
jgi:hypothetical protein